MVVVAGTQEGTLGGTIINSLLASRVAFWGFLPNALLRLWLLFQSLVMLVFREEKSPEDEIKAWQFWHSRQHSVKQRILDAGQWNVPSAPDIGPALSLITSLFPSLFVFVLVCFAHRCHVSEPSDYIWLYHGDHLLDDNNFISVGPIMSK